MEKRLAIIIPVYKIDFLDSALSSIALQTNKNFSVYIGDDNSPYDVKTVVDRYVDKINIVYKRFSDNLGGKNLVAQWTRCIEISKNEEWLWLFSDDDEMDPECVNCFYKELEKTKSKYDVYHFNIKVIDENSDCVQIPKKYPKEISSFEFYKDKMLGTLKSLVVENIFSRNVYNKTGGFEEFDLAWGSDTATWTKFIKSTGMYSIDNSYVLWRKSGQNISYDNSEITIERKFDALLEFYNWSFNFFGSNFKIKLLNYISCLKRLRSFRQYTKDETINDFIRKYLQNNYKTKLFEYIMKIYVFY